MKCAGHVWSTESVLVIRDFGVQLKSKRADGSVSRKVSFPRVKAMKMKCKFKLLFAIIISYAVP